MITIDNEYFLKLYGINLDIELLDFEDSSNKVTRTINLWTRRVYEEMRKSSARKIKNDDDLSDFQKETIKNAIADFGAYYLKNGDLFTQSGFDEGKGQIISYGEVQKLAFPKYILDNLRIAGLITKSFAGTSYIGGSYYE